MTTLNFLTDYKVFLGDISIIFLACVVFATVFLSQQLLTSARTLRKIVFYGNFASIFLIIYFFDSNNSGLWGGIYTIDIYTQSTKVLILICTVFATSFNYVYKGDLKLSNYLFYPLFSRPLMLMIR